MTALTNRPSSLTPSEQARAYLRWAYHLEALCRVMDVATAVTGVLLLVACCCGHPLLGLLPFGACLLTTAIATRSNRKYMGRAHLATLQVQLDHPEIDDGCDCR